MDVCNIMAAGHIVPAAGIWVQGRRTRKKTYLYKAFNRVTHRRETDMKTKPVVAPKTTEAMQI